MSSQRRSDLALPTGYALRKMRPEQPGELDLVVSRSMATVLETIPEFGGSAERVREGMPNFSHDQMRAMYLRDQQRPDTHRFIVAHIDAGEVVGHAIYFLRPSEQAQMLGYLFTLYVEPAHRRQGVANALMAEALAWLDGNGAVRVVAHTHVANEPLIQLATSWGFQIVERLASPWPHVALHRVTA